ncbi:hypothetical protein ACFQ8O_02445 [Streptomyces coelicoflavus]|uniref:hypothetical protein n=1 Tax=Streptomyces coelicoflavus TaxID=285562 RepID=UPI0036C517A6
MAHDIQRELIPRNDTIRLIGNLNTMKERLHDAFQQWVLLDENGHVPAAPSYPELLQHAANAQELSRDVLRLATEFARSPHATTRAGRAVLTRLASAASLSSHAAPHFADTAQHALLRSRASHSTEQHYLANHMVIDHADARAFLRRSSEALHDAVTELDQHLGLHRFLTPMPQQQNPAPPPPKRSGRHR